MVLNFWDITLKWNGLFVCLGPLLSITWKLQSTYFIASFIHWRITHFLLFCSFVVYLSTLCDDAILGKECLHAAINALFSSSSSETSTSSNNGDPEPKPTLLWSCVYIQEISQVAIFSNCIPFPMKTGFFNQHLLNQNILANLYFLVKFATLGIKFPVMKIDRMVKQCRHRVMLLYARVLHLMGIWITGIYWKRQRR